MLRNKNYIVAVNSDSEYTFDSLKEARDFIRSMININEVKGLSEKFEIYKETVARKKIDETTSNPKTIIKASSLSLND